MVHGFGGSSNDFGAPDDMKDFFIDEYPALNDRIITPAQT